MEPPTRAPRTRAALATLVALAFAALLPTPITAPPAAHAAVPPNTQAKGGLLTFASWHGRAIKHPRPPVDYRVAERWPSGWTAGPVALTTGYHTPNRSQRVREVQRRLTALGYRPGPIDGLFGPRTRAAVRWFAFKHGIAPTGKVTRTLLRVLQARSDHAALPRTRPRAADAAPPRSTSTTMPTDQVAAAETNTGGSAGNALIALVALVAVGCLTMAFRRERSRPGTVAASPPWESRPCTPPPATQGEPTPRVLGYLAIDPYEHPALCDAAVASLARLCERRRWTLVNVVHDIHPPDRPLDLRPGLRHVLDEIDIGTARGIVVSRLHDLASDLETLATCLQHLTTRQGFLTIADRTLDMSSSTGRDTALALSMIAGYEREGTHQPVRPAADATPPDPALGHRLATIRDRGISVTAIADALNIASTLGHAHARWAPSTVETLIDRATTRPRPTSTHAE